MGGTVYRDSGPGTQAGWRPVGGFEVGNLSVSRRKMAILLPGSPLEQKTAAQGPPFPPGPGPRARAPALLGMMGRLHDPLEP